MPVNRTGARRELVRIINYQFEIGAILETIFSRPVAKLKVVLIVPSTTKIFQVNFFLPSQFYK